MALSSRLSRWVPLIIVAVADFIIFVSVFYFVHSTSPLYTPLYYIVDALTFAAIVLTAQSIRFKKRFGGTVVYRSKPNLAYSSIVDDSESDSYKQKLKEASDLYLQGKINSDLEFFSVIGEHTPKEERIFRALKEVREKFEKMGRR